MFILRGKGLRLFNNSSSSHRRQEGASSQGTEIGVTLVFFDERVVLCCAGGVAASRRKTRAHVGRGGAPSAADNEDDAIEAAPVDEQPGEEEDDDDEDHDVDDDYLMEYLGEEDEQEGVPDASGDEAIEEALQQLEQFEETQMQAEPLAEPGDDQGGQGLQQQPANDDVEVMPAADGREMLQRMGLDYVARAPKISEVVFDTPHGEIRFNSTSQVMRAHCRVHAECSRQRTCRESDALTDLGMGQGRPLGALFQWLRSSEQFANRAEHMKAQTANCQQRRAARADFLLLDGAAAFSNEHERECRRGEPAEPSHIR